MAHLLDTSSFDQAIASSTGSAMMGDELYRLRSTLIGHSGDVRGVATGVTEEGKQIVVSASRDKTAKIWVPSGNGDFEVYQTCEGHTNFVVCACVTPPFEGHPDGLVLTGGNDHTILAFEMGKHNPVYRLVSHKSTVCSIAVMSSTELLVVSGSWDMTAKIWRGQDNIATLNGHSAAVWSVASIPGGMQILTGSADKEIRLWEKSETLKTFRGHTDCVRDLALLDKTRFISCSNDAQIIMWNIATGESVHTFYGHTNFIYSLTALPNNQGFASVGEDKTLRIWKGDEGPQVIFLPAMSVWSVAAMDNGDIVTGSSDGIVRIFTCDPERMASGAVQKEFEESVAHSKLAAQLELGGMKISELPGAEALLRPGKKDGDTKMIREGSTVVCYSWSEETQIWNKVGDVVGGSGATQNTSGRVLYEGMEYDYVFTVSLDDAGRSFKLPYNTSEDPWFAAQKFLERNDLEPSFLDQVANFIINNVKGVELGTPSAEFADPFTGGSRYIPGGASGPQLGTPAGNPSSGSTGGKPLMDRTRDKLRAEGIKLWLPPYFSLVANLPDDGEIIGLASRFASELGAELDDTVTCVLALQQHALNKLAQRNLANTNSSQSN